MKSLSKVLASRVYVDAYAVLHRLDECAYARIHAIPMLKGKAQYNFNFKNAYTKC